MEIDVDGDSIVALRGDANDPLSRGYVCPKAFALQDLHEDPDRLRAPLRKTADGGWEELEWSEALDYAAERIRAVQTAHGRDAVAYYAGNPNVHNTGAMMFGPQFVRTLRTTRRFAATSVDQLPHHFVSWLMFGHQMLIPIPDVDRTDFVLLLGGNPIASNGSLWTVPDVKNRLKAVRERGTLVVVDPRRSETARVASQHLAIRPGTDALLLAAMVQVIFSEDLVRLGPVADFTDGVDAVREATADYTPEAVATSTGLDAEVIRQLARDLATAERAAVHGRMGLSTQEYGGLCQWLVQVLNILTGNLDRPGGVLFTKPAVDVLSRMSRGSFGRWRSRVRDLPEFGGELPVAALAEEINTPGDGQIRALITNAGNPALSTPDGAGLERALAGLDFMVSIDPYLNETTRHAHLILPPASALTRVHYDVAFYVFAVRNVARFSPPLFPKPLEARHDWEILLSLEDRLGPQNLNARLVRATRRALGPRGLLGLGLRAGPYGAGLSPFGGEVSLRRLEQEPSGIDLGPLKPQLPGRLVHPDKRIALAPQELLGDLPRLRASLDAPAPDLVLIGRRHLATNNSWLHNAPRLMKGRNRCTLLVHPDDAARLGLTDGQAATLRSRVGEVVAQVEVSDEMRPGVVSLPHGWGHDRQGARLEVAARHPGVSINDVTDPQRLDALTGNAAFSGVPVEVLPIPP